LDACGIRASRQSDFSRGQRNRGGNLGPPETPRGWQKKDAPLMRGA